MSDRVYRNNSTKESREWWAHVDRLGGRAKNLVAGKAAPGDRRVAWDPPRVATGQRAPTCPPTGAPKRK